jgi:hypothetical protein
MDNGTISVLLALAGVAVGALVTWLVAWRYYEKASKDLRNEAETLGQLNVLMLRAMEEAGLAKFTRNAAGKPVGQIFQRSVRDTLATSDAVSVNAARESKPDNESTDKDPT